MLRACQGCAAKNRNAFAICVCPELAKERKDDIAECSHDVWNVASSYLRSIFAENHITCAM